MICCISVHNVTNLSPLGSQDPSMFKENMVQGIGAASVLRDWNLCNKGAIMKSNASSKQCLLHLGQGIILIVVEGGIWAPPTVHS